MVVIAKMRGVLKALSIALVVLLVVAPLGYSKSKSLEQLISEGYRVMTDAEFWAMYCADNPGDERCPRPKFSKKVVAYIGNGDNGQHSGNSNHGVGSQGKGQGLDHGRGHDPGHSSGGGHNYNK